MDDATSRELDQITIRSQADLHRLWSLLMRPLGFRSHSIWLTFVDPDRRPVRSLMEVSDGAEQPDVDDVAALCAVVRDVLAEHGPGWSVAVLVTRPGRGGLDDDDRALGRLLVDAARRAGVPLEPVHVATDDAVLALAPDDLAA